MIHPFFPTCGLGSLTNPLRCGSNSNKLNPMPVYVILLFRPNSSRNTVATKAQSSNSNQPTNTILPDRLRRTSYIGSDVNPLIATNGSPSRSIGRNLACSNHGQLVVNSKYRHVRARDWAPRPGGNSDHWRRAVVDDHGEASGPHYFSFSTSTQYGPLSPAPQPCAGPTPIPFEPLKVLPQVIPPILRASS